MKRIKLLAMACVVALCCSVLLAGCSQQSYTPTPKEQTISNSALTSSGTLRVGVNAQAAPLAGQTSSSSEIVGIDVDVAAAIADQLGLKLEVVDVGTDAEGALSSKRVDIVLGIDSATTDTSYWRSNSYLQTGVALFALSSKTSIPAADSNPSVAAQTSSKSSWRVTNLYGDKALNAQSDLKSAFAAMTSGKVDYVAADAIIGTYVAHSGNYDAKVIALLQDVSGYCVGVASSNTDLQSAVTSALKKMVDGGTVDIIETKWLGSSMDLDNTSVVKASKASPKTSSDSEESSDESTPSENDSDSSAE